jgi:hypothetical protein
MRHRFAVAVLTGCSLLAGVAMAQDQTPPQTPRPWRSLDQAPANTDGSVPVASAPPAAFPDDPQGGPPQQNFPGAGAQAQGPYQAPGFGAQAQGPYPQAQGPYQGPGPGAPNGGAPNNANYGVPPQITVPAGTFVTVRVNGWLSSDRNHQGDTFTATLAQPLVVNGIVVAQRGQTIGGRVTQAEKAGRVEGTSKLGIELTDLTLVDGSTVPVRSQMMNRSGPTSVGRDVGAVAGTTALGAAIGAGVDRGRGAAIGAGAGAAAGILGVLLTRGRPTVIYPETEISFRLDAPVMVDTNRAPQAFRYAEQPDYSRDGGGPPRYAAGPGPAPYPYAAAPYPYPYGGYGYGYPYPYYGGFGVYVGPRFYYGRPGFYGGYRYRR